MLYGTINDLFHYPIKGLSAQRLNKVALEPAQGFPSDRILGFARHDSGFDPDAPAPLPKDKFLVLMKDEQLAELDTFFDPDSWLLTIKIAGDLKLKTDMSTKEGKAEAEAFFARMFNFDADHSPRVAYAHPHRFTDISMKAPEYMNAISLINLASVAELGKQIDVTLDPARFRANINFDGWPAFSELKLVGKEVTIGDAHARIMLRTRRCAATEVNPKTAKRDIPIPHHLKMKYGHADLGVYAEILNGGVIHPGDAVTFEGNQ